MNEIAIKTEGLTKSFGPVTAVNNLNLEVRKGELFGLVGPDGAGKSTTMRLLTAIMTPSSGEGWVGGYSITSQGEAIKERIAYMSQRFGLYEDLTVMENIHFYADLFSVPRSERPSRIDRLLGFSNLTSFKSRLAGNLSGGMKQKLGLACALIHTPDILFLDEPTGGVDPVSRRDFWRILYDLLREGVTIFVSTAYLDEAERCTRVALMDNGVLLRVGEPGALRRSYDTVMMEIPTADPRRARDMARSLDYVRAVTIYGDRLHVALYHESHGPALTARLAAEGIETTGSRFVTPSLEDVFIHLATQQGSPPKEPGP